MVTIPFTWQLCALSLLSAPLVSGQAPRWQMQYFYDQAKSELVLQDIQTPSDRYVMAIGSIQDSEGRPQAGGGGDRRTAGRIGTSQSWRRTRYRCSF